MKKMWIGTWSVKMTKFFSYPHEVKDMINDTPCQDIELIDPSFDYAEGVKLEEEPMDSPLFHDER
jgi:hypothetical protein